MINMSAYDAQISKKSPYLLTSGGHFVLELCSNFLPILYPIYIATAGFTYSQVGLLTFIYVFFASATQPFFGYLSDRWHPGRLAIFGVVWLGLLMSITGLIRDFLPLAILIGLSALGSSIFHPSAASITSISNYSISGKTMALFSVSGNLGAALSPLLIGILVGWLDLRSTLVLIPITLFSGSLLFHYSLQNVNYQILDVNIPQHETEKKNKPIIIFIFILVSVMMRSWFYLSIQTYLPTWSSQSEAFDLSGDKVLFTLMLTVSIGSLLGGWLSDRIGHGLALSLGLILTVPFYWSLFSLQGIYLYLSLVGLGICIGFSFPTSIVLAQKVWPQSVGLASALVIGLAWAPGGIGASVTGLIADKFSLLLGLKLLVITPILAALSIILAMILWRSFEVSSAI
jgi:FSR family fosmidomycin resistance protein-like MFS transporter